MERYYITVTLCIRSIKAHSSGDRPPNGMLCMAQPLTRFHSIIIIILFESGDMAHTQTQKDIQTDRQTDRISKKCTIKHTKSHKNADGLTYRSTLYSFARSLLCLLQTYSLIQYRENTSVSCSCLLIRYRTVRPFCIFVAVILGAMAGLSSKIRLCNYSLTVRSS